MFQDLHKIRLALEATVALEKERNASLVSIDDTLKKLLAFLETPAPPDGGITADEVVGVVDRLKDQSARLQSIAVDPAN